MVHRHGYVTFTHHLERRVKTVNDFYPPPIGDRKGDMVIGTVRPSVRPCVRPCVRPDLVRAVTLKL